MLTGARKTWQLRSPEFTREENCPGREKCRCKLRCSNRYDRVIVAVPPSISSRITYEPGLPVDRAMSVQRLPAGTVVKCMAIYNEPFWRGYGMLTVQKVYGNYSQKPMGNR